MSLTTSSRSWWNHAGAVAAVNASKDRALQAAADALLGLANMTCPVEEGHLVGSGVAELREYSADRAGKLGIVAYGGPAVLYAGKQHEGVHYRRRPGQRSKWLELALEENRERLQRIVGGEVKI